MTGAGSAEVVAQLEGDYANSLGTGDPFEIGRDPSIDELDLSNQLEQLRSADSPWDVESVKQNAEGAVSIGAVVSADVHDQVEQMVFNDGGTAIDPTSLSASSRLLVGVNYATGTAERELYGCIPQDYSISYEQGGMVSYSLSMFYADEQPSATIDTSTLTEVTGGSSVPFHGFDLQLDGGAITVEDLQNCELSISEIARPQYGADPTAKRGVIAAPSAELTLESILRTPDRLEVARGSATGSLPDSVDGVPGTITLTSEGGTTVSTYNLESVDPDSYSWNQVVDTEDTTDEIQAVVTGENAVSVA